MKDTVIVKKKSLDFLFVDLDEMERVEEEGER